MSESPPSSSGLASRLREAACRGLTCEVRSILVSRDSFDLNSTDRIGWTALIAAASRGHSQILEMLMRGGADVNARTFSGRTALMVASEYGYAEAVRVLVANRAGVNAADNDGWTALMLAARYANVDTALALLAAGASANAVDRYGNTVLYYCTINDADDDAVAALVRAVLPCTDPRHMAGHLRRNPASPIRPALETWLSGAHPLQTRRRELEEVLFADTGDMPREIASLCGEYVHFGRLAALPGGTPPPASDASGEAPRAKRARKAEAEEEDVY